MNKKTFIRAVEFWLPDASGSLLEFGGGLFGAAKRFEAATRNLCFGRGEGLPGQTWECGHPLMLKDLQSPLFRRAAAALADGLTCAVALPVFVGERLSTVVVLFCSGDADLAGAIELWHNDPSDNSDMTLQSGHYGNTGDTFEFLSSHTSFRCGTGLPGLAWDKQAPVFMPDLGRGSGFLRADSALKVGINRGFAMPCGSVDGQVYVLACLSALATPIASQVDVWQPDALQSHLAHSFSFSETPSETAPPLADKLPLNDRVVGSVFATGVPVLDGQRIVCPVAMQDHITAVMALSL